MHMFVAVRTDWYTKKPKIKIKRKRKNLHWRGESSDLSVGQAKPNGPNNRRSAHLLGQIIQPNHYFKLFIQTEKFTKIYHRWKVFTTLFFKIKCLKLYGIRSFIFSWAIALIWLQDFPFLLVLILSLSIFSK